uniref:Leucine rich repeat containing 36 n=1 Tax=Cebus imitator TaxID=2715852 RepID=A0A2K5RLF7_CEBIM
MLRPWFLPPDDRAVREGERKAAKLHFSQLGNSGNFLLEVEKSSREKTMKNCVTDECSASKVSANVDSRIEMDSNKGLFIPFPNREIKDSLSTSATQGNGTPDQKLDTFPLGTQFRHYLPLQSTVRSPEKMTREGYRLSFLDSNSSGSFPEKELIPKPDTFHLTHDASLSKRLDVGDSSQIHPCQLPSDVGLENYDSRYSQTLSLHGSLGKRPQRSKNYQEYSIKPSNDIKATTSHSCGDLLTSLSNPDSSAGRLLKLSSDLYATTHFNSDPALLVNVEQQLSTSFGDLTPAHGSVSNNAVLGNRATPLQTLLLSPGTSEDREIFTKRSLSPSKRGFKWKDNILANLNPKHGFRDATGSEESLKQKLVRVLEENLILSEKIQQLEEGAAISIVSRQQSHTYDDLLHKNQQLTMQVACLNQELAQLKKLEETVAVLHESQRSLVVTNEYLLQQLNKEPKGYSGKALLPPEKGHHLGRSSPFGKSTLSSSSPVAHDTSQYLISVSDATPEPGLW